MFIHIAPYKQKKILIKIHLWYTFKCLLKTHLFHTAYSTLQRDSDKTFGGDAFTVTKSKNWGGEGRGGGWAGVYAVSLSPNQDVCFIYL